MTKVLLYGRFGQHPKEIEDQVKSLGFDIVKTNPEVVITYGGDGTILGAERDFPKIPKLPLKNSRNCHLCSPLPNVKLLELLRDNKLNPKKYLKLEATVGAKKVIALNDLVIAHKYPNIAIRFKIDSKEENIGDGVVFATPFGSTGYFYSITKSTFTTGFGMALNNIHVNDRHWELLPERQTVKVVITRGPAVLAADNDPNLIGLPESCEVVIRKSKETAYILSAQE